MSRASATPLLVATRNRHKTAEFADVLADRFVVRDLHALDGAPDPVESGDTFEANAAIKACSASRFVGGLAIADDSGLEVDALGGLPGVRSARYAGEPSDDAANNRLLLENLAGVLPDRRGARFRCALVLARDGEVIGTFCGSVEGRILDEARGGGGFGYDPLFVPDGFAESFAQLGAATKNAISHRARALAKFLEWLEGCDAP